MKGVFPTEEENIVEQTTKRMRRARADVRAEKIAILEEKIEKKEEQLEELRAQLEELKRPPEFSEREKQIFFRRKIEDGSLTEEEAYQLGYKG